MKKTCRNPFYEAVQREGITIAVTSPDHGGRITNPYYAQIAQDGIRFGGPPLRSRRPTVVHSVRIDPQVWKQVSAQAGREQISTNEAVRQALLIWLRS